MSDVQTQMLREAAKRIRKAIGDPDTWSEENNEYVIPGPWSYTSLRDSARAGMRFEVTPELDETYVSPARTEYMEDARYIAMMDPVTGAAVADLLDGIADIADVLTGLGPTEIRVAYDRAVEVANRVLS